MLATRLTLSSKQTLIAGAHSSSRKPDDVYFVM